MQPFLDICHSIPTVPSCPFMYSVLLSRLRLQSMMKSQFSDPFLHNIRFFTNDNTTTSESYCYIYVNNFSPTINLYQDRYIDLCSPPSICCSIRLFLDPQNKYYLDDFVYRPGMSLSRMLTTRVPILYDSEAPGHLQEELQRDR